MFLVISYSSDFFYDDDTICQFEISFSLTKLIDKYGKPTINHMSSDYKSEVETFDLNYFQFSDTQFNLINSYLHPDKINQIIEMEKLDIEEPDTEEPDTEEPYTEEPDIEEPDTDSTTKNKHKINLHKIIDEINDYRKKIYKLSPNKKQIPEPSSIKIDTETTITYQKDKKKLKQFVKMRKSLVSKYEHMMNTGQYYYLLLYFDKNTFNDFERNMNDITIINGDKIFYGCKPKKDWTTIEYELFYNQSAHFKFVNDSSEMINYIDNTILTNKEHYDNANIFYAKLNINKEFAFELSPMTEIWLKSKTHKTITTPNRLTYNKFYNEIVELQSEMMNETSTQLIQIYKTKEPIRDYGHHIVIELYLPITQTIFQHTYSNMKHDMCIISDILKGKYKYKLEHIRPNE